MFWTYRSQRLPRFRQASILHSFEGIKNILCIIASSLIFRLHEVFMSFLNLRRNLQLNLRVNFCQILCTNLTSSVDAELIDRNHREEKDLDVSFHCRWIG